MRCLLILSILLVFIGCTENEEVDLIIHNARIYTVDEEFSMADAFAVNDGRFVAVGSAKSILKKYSSKNNIDLQGKPVYPGLIDAHCHLYGLGVTLSRVNLVGTRSYEEVLEWIIAHHEENYSYWIQGRGWDQNDWTEQTYPNKTELDSYFPDNPVFIKRIDGHAAIVNQKALDLAGITPETYVEGGKVEVLDGLCTGILIDNAMDLVTNVIPELEPEAIIDMLMQAQMECLMVGLTTVDDAGLDVRIIDIIDKLQKEDKLKIRVYAMLNPEDKNLERYKKNGIYKTDRLSVRSVKLYADGALGSRGAKLIKPYSDMEDHTGFLVNSPEYLKNKTKEIQEMGFQVNTHCIGDSANRLMLNIYADILAEGNDERWRIEHAQVVNKNDLHLFNTYRIIGSIQPTHATSDMYWADERLGSSRIKGAYAYRAIQLTGATIVSGSDFPVEDVNPLYGFYAAVARKDLEGYPEDGFQMENALTRVTALRAMTIWAAYANFEESEKGSIETGKFADFVVLSEDIMEIEISDVPKVIVLSTCIDGEEVYSGTE
ncbi:MAG: amidohydrolase [Bacteroidetes bacterium]|nr:amidohydrolase [Bacteroidota bacterium]